ncbi:hypothetical protein AT05_10880 [Schleiferia thermophila str. Yellowstone]|nr:hypothetical protein AT05_10880 [Schleiferia thermophila str. Yellowstone]
MSTPFQVVSRGVETQKPVQREIRIGAYISCVTHLYETMGQKHAFLPLQSFGVPVGINLWFDRDIAFSIEFVPDVGVGGHILMDNFLFHPGFIRSLSDRANIALRLAFDTSGRIGLTPVLGYKLFSINQSSVSLSIPFPMRFGNGLPASFATGVQLGWGF